MVQGASSKRLDYKSTRLLFVVQRNQRIDSRRTAGRDKAGKRRHDEKDRRDEHQRKA
jgi:hypothetical protein